MAKLQKRLWGIALVAGVIGMGCSHVPGAAPQMVDGGGGATAVAYGVRSPIEDALTRSDSYFITQYYHKRYNPAQKRGNNANCGPTSLAMALRAFGKEPATLAGPEHSYELIRTVRQAMTGRVDEQNWTYPIQVRDGARKLGLNSEIVFTTARIREAMATPGRLVVVNLNPSPAYADKLVFPYNGGHFALVTKIEGDRVHISDPLAQQPFTISVAQLETALTTSLGSDPYGNQVAPYNGGIVLWK